MKTQIRSEAGSAYVITLLALVVLTILALSLALVTQTEVQVGSNERTVSRTFYSADSGLGVAVAEALLVNNNPDNPTLPGPRTVLLNKVSVGRGAACPPTSPTGSPSRRSSPSSTCGATCASPRKASRSSGGSITPSAPPRSGSPGPAAATPRPTRRCSGRRP